MTKVAILGAGIAGLSAGWLLQRKGIDFTIYEKQTYPGGLARSFDWNGFKCDFAAHRLFTTDENILQELLRLVPMGRHIRRSKIYLRGTWMRDPLDVFELSTHLSIPARLGILWSYLTRPRQMPKESFEGFVLWKYGRGLYDIFFKPYTEKLFGIPGDEISVLWARQKVRLANPFDAWRQNTKTKFQYFYYPVRGGYGAIVNKLYEQVQDHVKLNTTVLGLDTDGARISAIRYREGDLEKRDAVDAVISTMPLTLTGRMLGYKVTLNYKKVDSVYLHVNRPLVSDHHWVYFMDEEVSINRMVEFKNMSPVDTPEDTSVICAEVTQEHPDVVGKVIDDLIRAGMVKREEILDTKVVREEFAYPVYHTRYDTILADTMTHLEKYQNLYIAGRAAEFKHREADDNFGVAIEVVEKLAQTYAQEVAPMKTMKETKTEEPLIYAVVLAWNNYADTHECLVSVSKLAYGNLKTVLVDNGSTDNTPALVRETFPEVHIIENGRNLGVPAGYNVGFSYALENGADYILMLNNDTVAPADMLQKLLDVSQQDENIGVVMPKVLYYGTENEVWSSGGRYRAFPPAILMTDNRKGAPEQVRVIEYAPSCVLLITRQAFELAGLFDPGYLFLYDDWDFSERVRATGLKIWYAPQAQVWHKVSRSTKGPVSPLFWKTWGASTVRFYRRHGRPVWLSLPYHLGYMMIREFVIKGNWKFWTNFWEGVREGLQKPLGPYPTT
jgi:protoporphyrinogen oxidase/GT2 family glycosyltransferase